MPLPLSLRPLATSLLLALGFITLAGCATSTTKEVAAGQNAAGMAASTMEAAPELATFSKLVKDAGLEQTLSSGSYTIFAPSNDAFKAVPPATLDKLAKDRDYLKSVLSYHVLPAKITSEAISTNTAVDTLAGAKLTVSRAGDMITVDEGLVTKADLAAGNSVIHVIDAVLLPPAKK